MASSASRKTSSHSVTSSSVVDEEKAAAASPVEESIEATTLEGGLTVVTERMAEVRSVAMGFWVGTGSVDEEPAESGASHFLEHLLFKGTPTRSARQIAEAVDAVGGVALLRG